LTQSILRLEEKLGESLFHRSKTGCTPTATGKIFYTKAMKLKDCWVDIQQGIKEGNELQGRFRFGVHPSLGAYTLPNFFKKIKQNAPAIDIELHHDLSRKLTEKVISYELDLALVINPVKHKDLVLKKLGTDRIMLWKSSNVKKVPEILFTDWETSEFKSFMGKKSLQKFQNFSIVESSSLELIRSIVVQGAGIGFLPERVAKADGGKLECYDSSLIVQDEIYLIYRYDSMKNKAAASVLEAARLVI
jgi:DNA-binding transcriptional LysR family regulator